MTGKNTKEKVLTVIFQDSAAGSTFALYKPFDNSCVILFFKREFHKPFKKCFFCTYYHKGLFPLNPYPGILCMHVGMYIRGTPGGACRHLNTPSASRHDPINNKKVVISFKDFNTTLEPQLNLLCG